MKRALFILVLSFLCTGLWCARFQSNCLGQKTGPVTDENGWVIDEGDVSVLYHDGKPVRRYWTSRTEDSVVSTVVDLEASSTERVFFEDGHPARRIIETSDHTTVISYVYHNGMLSSVICQKDDELLWSEYYRRNSSDHSLVSVSRTDGSNLIDSGYVWDNGNLVNIISNDFAVSDDFEVDEDSNVVITRDGVTSVYDKDGRILSETSEYSQTTWLYDGQDLISKTFVSGESRVVDTYQDGNAVRSVVYKSDQTVSDTTLRPEGMIKTVFSDGKPLARVYYLPDDRHVERIEYL